MPHENTTAIAEDRHKTSSTVQSIVYRTFLVNRLFTVLGFLRNGWYKYEYVLHILIKDIVGMEREGEKAGGPQGLEFALTLGRGAALECHWHSIHSRTRSSPFIVHHNEKGCRIGILFRWYPLRDSNPGHPD